MVPPSLPRMFLVNRICILKRTYIQVDQQRLENTRTYNPIDKIAPRKQIRGHTIKSIQLFAPSPI